MSLRTSVLAVCAALMITEAAAEPDAVLYQLQERCGKSAAEVFAKLYSNGYVKLEGKDFHFNYQAHYNAHLNKCFFLEISGSFEKNNTTPEYRLFDLLENREYGSFTQTPDGMIFCNVQETTCSSRSEWDILVKPYMNE
jgi:hypothetical protein